MGIEINNTSLRSKQSLIVAWICIVLVSSLIIVDITSAGYEHQMAAPSFSDDFPDTVYFYNISEGVAVNIFSFIIVLPVNHSGHHHIVPSEITLAFWFRDATDGSDLSSFVADLWDGSLNCTFGISIHPYDQISRTDSGWWAPSLFHIVFYDHPNADFVSYGVRLSLNLINIFGDEFNGHELNTRLELNVTYSRWWYNLQINQAHQVVSYSFNLPDNGTAVIQSLEY